MNANTLPNLYALTASELGFDEVLSADSRQPNVILLGAVNAPGFICMRTGRPSSWGIVVQTRSGLEFWASSGLGLPDNSFVNDMFIDRAGLFNQNDQDLDLQMPDAQRVYFRAINLYHRIFPENSKVTELLSIFQDKGTLTLSQRRWVDENLYLGHQYKRVYFVYNALYELYLLSRHVNSPELDMQIVQKEVDALKKEGLSIESEKFSFEKTNQFRRILRPLSERIVQAWPPKQHVLSIWEQE